MAQHLPRKKYLSKLLGDETCHVDKTSSECLSANESTESLMTAIANSTQLGISSAFDSDVFTVDNELASSTDLPNSSSDALLQQPATDTLHSDNPLVYFDDGSTDDDDDDDDDDDSAAVKSSTVVSECTSQVPLSITSTSSSTSLAIPPSASMSNLIDDEVLNTFMSSSESLSNLLSSLESNGRSTSSIAEQQQQQSEAEMSVSSAASVDVVRVKEEQIDSSYDVKLSETSTTTSGRNRGRGKLTEPRYECQVCGDTAAGYHCGAYVCEACKVRCFTVSK